LLSLSYFPFNHVSAQEVPENIEELVEKFAPQVYLHSKEKYFPCPIEWYIKNCEFIGSDVHLEKGSVNKEVLAQQYAGKKFKDYYLLPSDKIYGGWLPVKENEKMVVKAPCYVNVVTKSDGEAIIQYMFFYAYNGPLTSVTGVQYFFNLGIHQADWEHIDVHVKKDEDEFKIEHIYFARHKAVKDGGFDQFSLIEKTHPIVFSSKYGHASYARNVKSVAISNIIGGEMIKSLDLTDTKGAIWPCWKNFVIVAIDGQPTQGNEWILFQGKWGKDNAPKTPSGQPWWRTKVKQYLPILTVTIPAGKEMSDIFSLKDKIPTYIKKLRWSIKNPEFQHITFSVRHDKSTLLEKKSVMAYKFIKHEIEVPISKYRSKLHISDIKGLDKTDKPIEVVIEGVFAE
jgi:hypothetical protein